jgi:hypothetical protein
MGATTEEPNTAVAVLPDILRFMPFGKGMRVCDLAVHLKISEEDTEEACERAVEQRELDKYELGGQTFYILP